MNRRQIMAMGLALSLTACGGGTMMPSGANATIADKFKAISDAVSNVLPVLGISPSIFQKVSADLSSLSNVIAQLESGGSVVSALTQNGAGIVQGIADALSLAGVASGPYGTLLTAALSMLPAILSLAGVVGRPALSRLAASMPAAEAEAIVRSYARRRQ